MTTRSFVVISVVSAISAAVFVGVMLSSVLRAPTERAPDKSGPGVVRVSVVEGSAVVQRGGSHVQTNAVRNAPMLPGDYISTGNTSRAELQFDGYTAVRLGGNVQARIVSDGPNRMQLAAGTTEIGIVQDGHAMQVDTPSVGVRARQAGNVRISIAEDGSSWITTRRGGVDVVTPQRTYTLGTGTTLVARGSASDPSVTYSSEVAFDSFDDFNAERDKVMVAALASPHLSSSIAGYDDLDSYGQWQTVAGYGQSWVPNEPAGWAPYRNGSWSWEGGYGWTWVGAEPWGWTPYHYGNWYYCDCGASGWAWLPPASAARPAWSPALVGFFAFNTGAPDYNNCQGNYGYAPGSYSAPAAQSGNALPAASYSSVTPAPYGVGGPSGPEPGPGGYGYPATPDYGSGYPAPYGSAYPYIGWVPIAPYEPFYAWYPGWGSFGFGWGYPTRITRITNITNITRIYHNFRHGGATATTMRNFRHGTVFGHTVAVTSHDLGRRFGTIHGALPVAPTRDNLSFSRGARLAPVTFSKVFSSPRFASDKALAKQTSFAQQQKDVAQAIRTGLTGHATAHATAARANAPISRGNAPLARANATVSRGNARMSRANAPISRTNVAVAHAHASETRASTFQARANRPVTAENAGMSRQIEASRRENAPVTHENAAQTAHVNAAPAMRPENSATMRENSVTAREDSEMREGSAASNRVAAAGNGFAPSASWDRFNEARGTRGADTRQGEVSAPNEAGREERASSDPWGRFSTSRGDSSGNARNPYDERQSRQSYAHESPSYSRGSYPSYSRGSYPSYSRGSYPSYSRGSYPSYSRGSYPSYSRGSYPSYSRGSYPSYSRGSYPSYSRGSYPSYSRGSYGSASSYSHGNAAPSGGGERHGGGGRPPH